MPNSPVCPANLHSVAASPSVDAAGRELLSLLGASVGVLATSIVVDRRALRLSHAGPRQSRITQIFADGPVTAMLRLLRSVLFLGSCALLIWLLGLIAVVVVGSRANQRVARLPFGQIVVRVFAASLVVAVTGPLVGTGGAAGAAGAATGVERTAANYTDSGGGQRWPNLAPPHTGTIATAIPGNTPAPVATTIPPTVETTTAVRRTPTTKLSATTTTARGITGLAGPILVFALAPPAAVPGAVRPESGVSETPVAHHAVRRGECFWSIAETLVLTRIDEATEADIAHYWRQLIEANRSKLPDSSNPDLLWAGTVLDLPALPAGQPPAS